MITLDHIHPMLVHFPLVLLPLAVVLDLVAHARGDQGRRGFAALATAAYVGGAAAAGLAAMFGDVAVDIAIGKGFPAGLFETHEDLAIATTVLFSAVAAVRLVTLWRGLGRGFVRATTGLAALGVVLLLAVAYEGGALVYDHGVNVAAVMR